MPTVYYWSDPHFFHQNILKFEAVKRPFATIEEHNEALVNIYNSVVKPDDTCWMGGDIVFGDIKNIHILNRLNGKKNLILGNHDTGPKVKEYVNIFDRVLGSEVFRNKFGDFVMTHIPVHTQQFDKRFIANIHGHLHSHLIDDPRYFNISCEHNDLKPISYDEIVQKLRDRRVIKHGA